MLRTKLYRPKIKDNLVNRQGLAETLEKANNKKLVLISAPAGYGKTTLVSQWIEKNNFASVWYSLDNSDNDSTVFLSYLITGIQTIKKDFGRNALNLLSSSNSVQAESIVTLLINNLLEFEDELYIVLDDVHVINQKDVFDAINFLLAHLPQHVHLIILTRSDPPLSISRLRSQNELLEIRISDLSFSANEITYFFNKKLKLGLKDTDIITLEEKTEGWIAGLQLAALSMQGIEDKSNFIEDFAGSNRFIMDYLIEEVLKKQSDDVQEFLLKTSFLKQISAPLCNSILNRIDCQLLIEQLDRDNMFVIPLDRERKWYRYHHLFADLLKQRLLLENKTEAESLQKQASIWLEKKGFNDLAIEHVLEIKDYKRSIEIIGRNVEKMWEQGKHAAILNYGILLPENLITENPEFCLYLSWIFVTTGERDKAANLLLNAEKNIERLINDKKSSNKDNRSLKQLLGKTYVALAHLHHDGENPNLTSYYCNLALENLSAEDALWLGWAWFFLGSKELSKGNVEQGNEGLNNALKYSKRSGNIYLMSVTTSILAFHKTGQGYYKSSYKHCSDLLDFIEKRGYQEITKVEWTFSGPYSLMACIKCIWTDFNAALENAKIGYDLCKKEKEVAHVHRLTSLYAYSFVLYSIGKYPEAEEKLNELEDIVGTYKTTPFQKSLYIGWKIFLLVESNQIKKADEFAIKNGIGLNKEISYENEYAYLNYIRLLLAENNFNAAELILSDLYKLATSGNRIETLVQLKISSAIIYKSQGKNEKAIERLTEAMELACEEYLLNFFLFDIEITKDLVDKVFKIHATRITKISKTFVQKLKSAIETKLNQRHKKIESNLSEREVETLLLLAEDFSNKEIADKLFISLNTVKTRLKNIFLKLEVDSRRKAVEKAQNKGLI